MSSPLISPAWRVRTIWTCGVALAGFIALAAVVAGGSSTAFDSWLFRELYAHTGTAFASTTLALSEPALSISICAVIAVGAAVGRRWDVAVLASVGPALTVVLTKYVLKPLLDRELSLAGLAKIMESLIPPGPAFDKFAASDYSVTGTYPSGHESAVAATACVLVILTCRLAVRGRVRAVLLGLIGGWTLIAAVGLVRNFWHYGTDTIGAMLLAVTVVFGLALLLDRHFEPVWRRLRERRAARVS